MQRLREELRRVAEASRPIADAVARFLESHGGEDVFIAFCGPLHGVSNHLAAALKLFRGVRAVGVVPADSYAHLLAPYAEEGQGAVIHLVYPGAEACLVRSAALGILRVPRLVVSGRLDDRARRFVYGAELLEVGGPYTITLLHAALRLASSGRGARSARLESELELEPVVHELLERYGPVLEELRGVGDVEVLHSFSMTPAAEELYRVLVSYGRRARLTPHYHTPSGAELCLALYTTAEEHTIREKVVAAARRCRRVLHIGVGTDPVTAPIYVLILVRHLELELAGAKA